VGELQRDSIARSFESFLCLGCLRDKPTNEQSSDPRYCKWCCQYLLNEAKTLNGRHPNWTPKAKTHTSIPESHRKTLEHGRACDKTLDGISGGLQKQGNFVTEKVAKEKGRKPTIIPKELIEQLTKEGFTTCRALSEKLNDYGITASYRTIARELRRVTTK
jgi:hypothetical protein